MSIRTSHARAVLIAVLVTALLTACSATGDAPPLAEVPSPAPTPVAGDPLPPDLDTGPIVASWDPAADPVELGGGRWIGDCEGEVPALCVSDGTTVLGLLEDFRFPVPSELADRAGDDLDRALRDFAAARVAEAAQDRRVGCGGDHEVLPDAPGSLSIDGSPGLRYGFATVSGGVVVEHVVTWATVRDGELRLVVAHAASPDGCMASELTTFPIDELVVLLPVLDRVMTGTPLAA